MAGARHKSSTKVKGNPALIEIPGDTKKKLGVSPRQIYALSILKGTGKITTLDLAIKMGLSQSNVSHLVGALDRLGYIAKTTSTADFRQKNVMLTDKGKKLLKRM